MAEYRTPGWAFLACAVWAGALVLCLARPQTPKVRDEPAVRRQESQFRLADVMFIRDWLTPEEEVVGSVMLDAGWQELFGPHPPLQGLPYPAGFLPDSVQSGATQGFVFRCGPYALPPEQQEAALSRLDDELGG